MIVGKFSNLLLDVANGGQSIGEPSDVIAVDGMLELKLQIALVVGPSRKRFIGAVLEEPRAKARLWGTAAVVAQCVSVGVDVVRVHDGGPIVQVARMADALWR